MAHDIHATFNGPSASQPCVLRVQVEEEAHATPTARVVTVTSMVPGAEPPDAALIIRFIEETTTTAHITIPCLITRMTLLSHLDEIADDDHRQWGVRFSAKGHHRYPSWSSSSSGPSYEQTVLPVICTIVGTLFRCTLLLGALGFSAITAGARPTIHPPPYYQHHPPVPHRQVGLAELRLADHVMLSYRVEPDCNGGAIRFFVTPPPPPTASSHHEEEEEENTPDGRSSRSSGGLERNTALWNRIRSKVRQYCGDYSTDCDNDHHSNNDDDATMRAAGYRRHCMLFNLNERVLFFMVQLHNHANIPLIMEIVRELLPPC